VGDPDVGMVTYRKERKKEFLPLPGARKEAEMIGRMLGVDPLIGQQATKQAVLERLRSVLKEGKLPSLLQAPLPGVHKKTTTF